MSRPSRIKTAGPRRNALWMAAMAHRLSGLALACFLPLHFLTLGTAIHGEEHLASTLRWMDNPLFKAGEAVLVFLLAVHMLGGIRVLAIENLPWRGGQKSLAFAAVAIAALAGFVFLMRAI